MTSAEWVRATPDGVCLLVKVVPRAGVTAAAGIRDGRLLVRLAAPPVEGAANEALIAFVAKSLKVPARQVTLERGGRSRNKQVGVRGVSVDHAVDVFISPRR
jgi:uncharacterized protein (TIGR00251 family)